MNRRPLFASFTLFLGVLAACHPPDDGAGLGQRKGATSGASAEYFHLRPEIEQAFGYTHAVKIGGEIKVSGAVSMDDAGNPTSVGDLEQQMKNVYSDLASILRHYGYSFDDVVAENIFTTDMASFLQVAGYRNSVYTTHFPTGTWVEVKSLASPEFLIEIEIEAYRPD